MARFRSILFFALLAFPAVVFAEAPTVLFVFDASGSMWGQVEGKSKIEVARAVMGDAVKSLPEDVRIGLVAYGHNRKDDCKDIEIVTPIGSSRDEVAKAVTALNPKGQTPLTDSLRFAAAQLKKEESAASVVLVSDGKESCGGDPCAAAREAVAAGVKLRIHVVGFDVTPEEADQLRCIAKEGKGKYFSAKNTAELTTALSEVKKEVAAAPTPAPPPPPPATAGEVPTKELSLAPGKVKLSARLGPETPVLVKGEAGMWTVLGGEADLEGNREQVSMHHDAEPVVTLTEGEYALRVKVGDASRLVLLHVKPGSPAAGEVVLGAGQVKLSSRLGPQTPVLVKGEAGMWTILEGQVDFEGHSKQVAMHHDAQPVVTLNEGDYKVRVKFGDAEKIADLAVRTGDQKPVEVVLGAGQVKLSARLGPQSPVLTKGEAGLWTILQGQSAFEETQNQVAMHHDAEPVVTLNEGDYKVKAKIGEAVRTADLKLAAGEQKRLEVVIGAGQVKLVARRGAGGPVVTTGDAGMWTVYEAKADFEGQRKQVAMFHDAQPIATLNEGSYQVEVKIGGAKQVSDFTVGAGEQKVVEVETTAAP